MLNAYTSISCYLRQRVSSTYRFFFFNDTATTEIYTLSLHDALPILRAAILSLANRLSHLLTRAARVSIFKAICLPFSPLAARRIFLALWTIRCSAFELRIQRKSVSFSSVERRISGAGRLISPAFSVITLSFARKY